MHILRDPSAVSQIANPDVRSLIERRFCEISAGEPWDADRHGYFIVAEPCDRAESLELVSGCAIVHEPSSPLTEIDPPYAQKPDPPVTKAKWAVLAV